MKRVIQSVAVEHDPAFSAALIVWQKQHGRHQLPWQQTRDAYRIWLSEIMLQQTQVSTVIPYYHRFLQHFPQVGALAAAPVEQVMSLWAGIGPSTAAAIAAFAYGQRAAILDGNVKRVLCRVFGIAGFPGQLAVERQLWQLASALLPAHDIEAYTQGLMDLGATVCTRTRPRCAECPWQARCVAKQTERIAELPTPRPKKATPEKHSVMLWIIYADQLLLEQRPPSGIWGGLQSLPELTRLGGNNEATDLHAEVQLALADIGEIAELRVLPEFRHAFTHFRLRVTPLQIRLRRRYALAAQDALFWQATTALDTAALPAPVRKLLTG